MAKVTKAVCTEKELERVKTSLKAVAMPFAEKAAPVFYQKGWKWGNGVPDKYEIAEKVRTLTENLKLGHEAFTSGGGRIEVFYRVHENGEVDCRVQLISPNIAVYDV